MKQSRILSLLGLATRSRNLVSGEFMTEKEVKAGNAKLVLVAEDASDNTREMFKNMCSFYSVPIYCYSTKEELGRAMGKAMRASLAVLDTGFADAIIEHLEKESQRLDGGSEYGKN